MRRVEQIMGMPITIDIPETLDDEVFAKAFERLEQIDKKFSTYKPDSEVYRFIRGEITEADLSGELKEVIKACREAEATTDGYFSAWAADKFDPSGYVKGWAIAEAGKVIEKEGFKTYCISAGGDILARSDSDKVWNIGIQDPLDKTKILNPIPNLDVSQSDYRLLHSGFATGQASLKISNGAVATSGNYERSAHIINPKTQKPAAELLSVTITGPDIIKADILATACFAMGIKATSFMQSQKNYKAIIIDTKFGNHYKKCDRIDI